ncbi:DeoR/GlpR family DNA-binding transcription regulator [Pacificoceanicola onchidii]|uniref:DeoR/GlpR family DNA-binding transcription regulator n=1 Tax=Pacificoceanicola onchidii TaxID=2562685 RepID=UPI00145621C4|nr:DeoR/GlpR family DNA-binding transcription regulator [Pacificoceanicola onchidii]
MPKNQSKKSRRHDRILDVLRVDPAKRVSELARDLGVSAETIRRDLADLDAAGSIKRTYGGAVRRSNLEPALSERLKLHVAERERIARAAVGLLDGVESLYIGGGATTLLFARAMSAVDRHLTVLTASFQVAIELAANPQFDVISLPGNIELQEGLLHGPETLRFIGEYNVHCAIVGASAVDEIGVSEALPSAAGVYTAMIGQAQQTIVVADRSKLGTKSLKRILHWGEDTTLVTDSPPSRDMALSLTGKGVRIVVASDAADP